jgi:hypothetical protein
MDQRGGAALCGSLGDVAVHMWSPRDESEVLSGWQPDVEPTRYADGRGHALLELAARLSARGVVVSIGPTPPFEADVVVVFAKDLAFWHSLRWSLTASHLPVIIIESDWQRRRTLPIDADVLVRSSASDVVRPRDVSVPLLPQRGIVPRHADRFGQVRTLGYQGDPSQAPEFLTDGSFRSTLLRSGIEVRLADRSSWHDFSGVDVVLCLRRAGLTTDHKPPTKLINAWAAGCIPLIGPERSYAEWATDEVDALAVTDADSVLDALVRMSDARVLERLERGCAVQRDRVTMEAILEQWIDVIAGAAQSPRRTRARSVVRAVTFWGRAQLGDRITRRSIH